MKAFILWIETEDEESVQSIYSQAAHVQNHVVRTINFFPGEIYDRMKEIESHCKNERSLDPTFKYQIRIGTTDLILKYKKGSATNFTEVPLNNFGPISDFHISHYKGNSKWEESSPPKGRRPKRNRSNDSSPETNCKKPMFDLSTMGAVTTQDTTGNNTNTESL